MMMPGMAEKLDLGTLVARLALPDPAGRQAQEAIYAAGAVAVRALGEAVRSRESSTARRAAEVLGWFATPDARAALLDALAAGAVMADLRAVVVRAACEEAGLGDAPALLPKLVALAEDRDYFVRAAACDGLGRLGDARAEPVLRRGGADAEKFVRDAALRALAGLPPSVASRASSSSSPSAMPASSKSPASASASASASAPASPSASASASAPASASSAAVVPSVPAPSPSERLRTARTAAEREEALEALVAQGRRSDLEEACDDFRPAVRLAAVRGLAALRDRRALDRLCALVTTDADADVRGLAARAVSALVTAADAPARGAAFLQWSFDADGWVRAGAVGALGIAPPDDVRALPRLVALVGDAFDPVAEAAARACLAHAHAAGTARWPDAVRAAIGRLADESRQAAPSEALLVALLDLCAALVGPDEAPFAAHAARLFLRGGATVRAAAVRLLGAAAPGLDPELVLSLVALLDDPAAATRRSALQALAAAAAAGAGPPALGSAGLERITRFLDDPDAEAGALAVRLLARVGSLASARALCRAAHLGGPTGRAAAEALAAWPTDGDVAVHVLAGGELVAEPVMRCGRCRAELAWAPAALDPAALVPPAAPAPREELRCARCGTLHALGARDRVVPVTDAPLGVCACAACARPHLLVTTAEGIVCPVSAERYVLVADTRTAVAVRTLPYGVCACCASPQPLEREVAPSGAPRVVCRRTRAEHVPDTAGRYAPVTPAATLDGAAIDRALLAGSLRVGRSGVAAPAAAARPDEDDL
jgi:HEAT repeat protein